MNKDAESRWKVGMSNIKLKMRVDTSQFLQPAPFTFGSVARTLPDVRTHGVNNLGFSFFKNTMFGSDERYNLQFRAEFFNIFDRTQFGFPNLGSGSTAFGVVTDQQNESRIIQFGLKFIF